MTKEPGATVWGSPVLSHFKLRSANMEAEKMKAKNLRMPSPRKQQECLVGDKRRQTFEALLTERRPLLDEVPAARAAGPDPADAARELKEEMVWLAVLDRSYHLQAQVDHALHRLASGRYGICLGCEGPIPPARLEALPFAVRCLPCQERFERIEKERACARGEGHNARVRRRTGQ